MLSVDLGLLAVSDSRPSEEINSSEDSLKQIAQDNFNFLLNSLLSLPAAPSNTSPTSNAGSSTIAFSTGIALLPPRTTRLPREKPVPQARPPTKWEAFAAKKGIKPKGKRSSHEYDEKQREWLPTHGARSSKHANDEIDNWCTELDGNGNEKTKKINPHAPKRERRK